MEQNQLVTCPLMSGLGNQLFQIFTTIAYSIKYDISFCFCYSLMTQRKTYWNDFLQSLKSALLEHSLENTVVIKENSFHYSPLYFSFYNHMNKNIQLMGCFQSYKYFEKEYLTIFQMMDVYEQKIKIAKKYNYFFVDCISLHFRYQEYVHIEEYHTTLDIEYYRKALEYILTGINHANSSKKQKVIYFCHEMNHEWVYTKIKELEKVFPTCLFMRVPEKTEDWEQLLMMSLCKHNIISNSLYAWWGAHFNCFVQKIVCYPNTWFGPALSHYKIHDLCPREWISIE
jgi:hypothetical protein